MTMEALRERSESLFTQLLTAQTRATRARRASGLQAARPAAFSWFEADDPVAAAAMSFRLSALAASEPETEDCLAAALAGDGDPDEDAYCDCGWPYTLLLPGAPHRAWSSA